MNLFESNYDKIKPLALRLRPTNLDDFIGQEKILGKGGVLRKLIEKQSISNSIFFGPPGCGKSSLGEIISKTLDSNFETLNATVASLNDLREIVEKAKKNLEFYGKKTILFLDEIHRFNKLQQDALLSYCESGILTLIGATTENPYYSLNNALLSRVMIFEFKSLSRDNIREILEKGVKYIGLEEKISKEVIECILDISQGDSRIAINYLELYQNSCMDLEDEEVLDIFRQRQSSYHKAEDKYNLISALIKSMRGSDPDAALYWLGRLLHGGEDPRYIARRIMIHASEKIGMPEVKIILAQAVIYLSISTKSNSCYMGINKAMEDIEKGDMETVPLTICHNAKGYKYPHDYAGNFVKQNYTAKKREYYVPGDNKNEKLIKEKMEKLWGK